MSPRSHGLALLLLLLLAAAVASASFLPFQSRTIGNITYGPGVCGATLDCGATVWRTTPITGTCGVHYLCNTTTPWGRCTPANDGCECWDNCIGGGTCSLVRSDLVRRVFYFPDKFVTVTCANVTQADVNASLALVPSGPPGVKQAATRAVALTPSSPQVPCGGRCDNTTQVCVRQSNPGVDYQRVLVDGVPTNVMNSEVCCPRGSKGDACEIPVGCSEGGCDNGGQCLRTTSNGVALAPRDTRCFGCPPGNNVTGPGWGGAFCHIRNTPTFVTRNVTATGLGRRLLQTTQDTLYRASQLRNTAISGAIFQEPSRACDCAVRWSAPVTDSTLLRPILLMGNVSASLEQGNATLLSAIKFGVVDGVVLAPYWHRRVRSLDEGKWLCARDWGTAGLYLWTATADATYIGSMACVADLTLIGSFRAAATVTPANSPSLFPAGGSVQFYALSHVEDAGRCPDPTLDRDYYCATYPTQCAAIIQSGGVGNKRIPDGLTTQEQLQLAAVMHFSLFGHLVRNSPNAGCDLTSDWAEDETGCLNLLRTPKSLYPLPANTTLTAAICGNVSRIADPARVAFGPLHPLATGTNVSDSGHSMCQCNPPFRPADPAAATDCAYDLCGTVDGRGKVNATYVGTFNHSAAEACVCTGVWGTDPATCSANTCSWCGSTICQNLGIVNGSDYTAACECLPIFTGTLCETSLCNVTNTHPFNETLWKGHPASTVVCDCIDGFTGTFCDDLACVHGVYSYEERTCACEPGFHGPQCQYYICAQDHGLYVLPDPDSGRPESCACYPPWTGQTCEEHTCDSGNVMLSVAGWNGTRPFGQPVLTQGGGPTLWECGCNFPYMPTAVSDLGRPLNCYESVCGPHGSPNANASNVLVPTDACTCVDPFNKGIRTDPAECTDFTYAACRTPCMKATCGLSPAVTNLTGFVPIAYDDASCCRCPATVGYFIRGECQPFCAFTQPCITSLTSSFLEDTSGVNVTSGLEDGDNTVRIAVGGEWKCACDAGYHDPPDGVGGLPCSVKLEVPRDSSQNVSGFDYGQAAPPLAGDSGSSGSSVNTNTLAIGVAAGLVGAFIAASLLKSAVMKAPAVIEKAAKTVTTTTTTVVSTGAKMKVKRATGVRYGRLLSVMTLFGLVTGGWADPLTWSQVATWGTTTVPGATCDTDTKSPQPGGTASQVSFYIPPGIRGYIHPGENWYGWPFPCGFPALYMDDLDVEGCSESGYCHNYVSGGDVYGNAFAIQFMKSAYASGPTFSLDYRFRFDQATATSRHITVGRRYARVSDASWSMRAPSGTSNTFGFALNMCDRDAHCNAPHGTCVPRYGFTDVDSGGGFVSCTHQLTTQVSDVGWTQSICVRNQFPVTVQRTRYEVRGCLCEAGWGGQHCEVQCPTNLDLTEQHTERRMRDLCTGHGWCATSDTPPATRFLDAATCICAARSDGSKGCQCDKGWTGEWCEIAIQSSGPFNPVDKNSPELLDFSTCCPMNSPACAPMQVAPDLIADAPFGLSTCTPTGPCNNDAGCPCTTTMIGTINTQDIYALRDGKAFAVRLPLNPPTFQWMPFPNADLLSVRVPAGDPLYNPYKCGEGDITPSAGWIPETQAGNEVRGHGKCWIGIGTGTGMSPNKAYCVCSNPNLYNNITGDLISQQRRGWFGPQCQYRTCTRQLGKTVPSPTTGLPVVRDFVLGRPTRIRYGVVPNVGYYVEIDPSDPKWDALGMKFSYSEPSFNAKWGDPAVGLVKQLEIVYPSGNTVRYSDYPPGTGVPVVLEYTPIQCSGHWAGQVSIQNFNYDDDRGPCDDKPVDTRPVNDAGIPYGNSFTNINSIGRCKACDHGWGLYANMNRFSLNGTNYDPADWGICSERTYHSGAGAQCGGYGIPTLGPVFTINSKTVPTVTGCDCGGAGNPWGLVPYKDSGICQRTCAADELLLSLPASVRNEFGLFNGTVAANFTLLTQLSARCGGFRQGLCRPITFGKGYEDGLNSACMCNAGYGGPACTNLTSMWNQGALCGLRGEAVLTPISPVNSTKYSSKGYADEAWFNQYIVPLNGANITDPLNAKLYTAYQCRCTPQATADGWAVDSHGICAPTCSSVELRGAGNSGVCSGHGTCVTDTRLGGIGKACRCDLGWGGLNCGQRIYVDRLGQTCGGADRGVLAYVPAQANFTQQCVCNAGYSPNPHPGNFSGLCYKDCPYSSSNGLQCAGPAHGSCSVDLVTGNDDVCHCDQGAWGGATCDQKLLAVYTTASGTQIACTGHGLPHPDGIGACSCDPGWIGEACHVYGTTWQCGTGQSYFDAEAVGIVIG